MTEKETTQILMAISTMFPHFKAGDRATTIKMWTECLGDLTYDQVSNAVKEFIMSDTKGFPPTVGQIRANVAGHRPAEIMGEGRAWELVYNALQNGYYGAEEEYNKLPEDVRRALGGAGQLRQWAVMDLDSISVAESNFKRSYRAVVEQRARMEALPANMRPQIGAAPVAQIEDKACTEDFINRASEDYVASLLDRFRDDLK